MGIYWDIGRTLSYNCLFNFIVGARGVGKTYGCKEWAIKDFLKNRNQFVYVRRYKEELKKSDKFFEDIKINFPEHEFKVNKPNFYIDGEIAGTCIALSTAKIEKSTPFPRVNKIIFDEFILDKGFHRYLPDEVTNFLELYSTIARLRDVKVMFLSNALTFTNPYFIYFDIQVPYGASFRSENDILIEVVKNDEYTKVAGETRFSQIIKNTPYYDYSVNNKFLRDTNTFIERKSEHSKFVFTLVYKGEKYGIWIDYTKGLEYVSKDYDPNSKAVYAITTDDHTPNTMLLRGHKSVLVESFIKYYKLGLVRFESVNIKNICMDIIKLTL